MPSRGLARTTAPKTTVSPYCTVTDPSASLASVPVSMRQRPAADLAFNSDGLHQV